MLVQIHLVAGKRRGRRVDHHPAAVQDDDVVGDVEGELGVLLDQQDRQPLLLQAPDRGHHLGDDLRRQALRRLVEQQHPRVRHQRPADRQHLLLAARQDAGIVLAPLGELREGVEHPLEGPRVLPPFSEDLSKAANERLKQLGVEVRLGHSVDQIDGEGIVVGGERIASKTVIWTAGVAPSPAGKWLNVETDRAGRVLIKKDLTVPGHPEIFVVGDTAAFEQDGKPLPGVAQVAMQQGRYAGRLIHSRISATKAPKPFRYFDKGSMAVVGKGFAVLQSYKVRVSGFGAWLTWAGVHLQFLATSSLRVAVFFQWVWTYFTNQRGSRLIVNHHESQPAKAVEQSSSKPAVA